MGHPQAKIGALAVFSRNMLSPMPVQRPLASHISRGFRAGKKNSWPIVSISRRTMSVIFRMDLWARYKSL